MNGKICKFVTLIALIVIAISLSVEGSNGIKHLRQTLHIIERLHLFAINNNMRKQVMNKENLAKSIGDILKDIKFTSIDKLSIATPIGSDLMVTVNDVKTSMVLDNLSIFDCRWFINEYKKDVRHQVWNGDGNSQYRYNSIDCSAHEKRQRLVIEIGNN